MVNEPERPIEKLLHAAAQKRRDEAGAPFELHPATRRLLQGEVTRQFARPPREGRSWPSLLAQLWPRLVGATAILAVLGMAVWLVLAPADKATPEMSLALNQPVSENFAPTESASPAPVRAPAVAPPPAAAGRSQTMVSAFDSLAPSTPAPMPPAPTAKRESLGGQGAVSFSRSLDKDSSAQAVSTLFAERQKAAGMQLSSARELPAAAPAGAVGGTAQFRDSFAAKPAPPAGAGRSRTRARSSP